MSVDSAAELVRTVGSQWEPRRVGGIGPQTVPPPLLLLPPAASYNSNNRSSQCLRLQLAHEVKAGGKLCKSQRVSPRPICVSQAGGISVVRGRTEGGNGKGVSAG